MTKQEFVAKLLETRIICVKYKDNVLITDEQKEFYQALNMLSVCFEKNIFDLNCFEYIDAVFDCYKIDLNSNIHLIAHLINIGINFYDEKEIRNSLDTIIVHAKRHPDEVHEPAVAKMSSEEYEFQVEEMKKEVRNLRKYVDENGNILPVSPEDSNPLDFKYVFKIEDIQVKAIIKACNKKYFQLQKKSTTKKEFIIHAKSTTTKTSLEITAENKQKNLAYKAFTKFISLNSKKYQIIVNDLINEEDKVEIIRLAKIIGISDDNQKIILTLIEKHNNNLLRQEEELLLKEQKEQLLLAMEQIKTTYFTEEMYFNYNKVLCIVNDISLINDQSLNYIITKLKVAKESIDATMLALLKEDLSLDDFKELLELSFEDLNSVLLEAKHYNIINQSLERIKNRYGLLCI